MIAVHITHVDTTMAPKRAKVEEAEEGHIYMKMNVHAPIERSGKEMHADDKWTHGDSFQCIRMESKTWTFV